MMGLFGGSDVSSAEGHSAAAINSSGWVVGQGNAQGGRLESSTGAKLPWYAWAAIAAVGLAWLHYRKKG